MIEIIASIVLFGSIAGLFAVIYRKMPALKQIPKESGVSARADFWTKLKSWSVLSFKKIPYFRNFSWLDFLQKILLKGKLLVLKTENKLNEYMLKLRQRAENQKQALPDNYWHDIKTTVKTKKPLDQDEQVVAAGAANAALPDNSALPESEMEKNEIHSKKKHFHKKRRFRDPFKW